MIRSILAALLMATPVIASAQVGTGSAATQQLGRAIDSLATKAARLPSDRRASLVAPLRALGPTAVDGVLQRLNADSPAMSALKVTSPAAHDAFVAALLDALGSFRSPRAEPTFARLFEAKESPALVARMAAEGLGRLCTTSSIATLSAHATTGDSLATNAADGLGQCRKESSAAVLTGWLATRPPADTTRAVAQALGMQGSSWAWQALGAARADEGKRIRTATASALMAAYPHYEGDAARALMNAILMVDEPSLNAAISQLHEGDVLRVRWARLHRR